MMGASYPTKKALKLSVGQALRYVETSWFAAEYTANGEVQVVGPDAYTNRKWYASVVLKDGKIVSVK